MAMPTMPGLKENGLDGGGPDSQPLLDPAPTETSRIDDVDEPGKPVTPEAAKGSAVASLAKPSANPSSAGSSLVGEPSHDETQAFLQRIGKAPPPPKPSAPTDKARAGGRKTCFSWKIVVAILALGGLCVATYVYRERCFAVVQSGANTAFRSLRLGFNTVVKDVKDISKNTAAEPEFISADPNVSGTPWLDVNRHRIIPKFAYVQVVRDEEELWRSLAVAATVRNSSEIPLVLIANSTDLNNWLQGSETRVYNSLSVPVVEPGGALHYLPNVVGDWKKLHPAITAAGLLQLDKIMWLQTATMMTRGADDLFLEKAPLAYRKDFGQYFYGPTDMVMLEPTREQVDDLAQKWMETLETEAKLYDRTIETSTWHDFWKSDQKVLADAFSERVHPWNFDKVVSPMVAPLGCMVGAETQLWPCLELAQRPPGFENSRIPTLVFSSNQKEGRCFYFDTEKQIEEEHGKRTNVCQHHVGMLWRAHFCRAIALVQMAPSQAYDYCNDGTYITENTHPPLLPLDVRGEAWSMCNAFWHAKKHEDGNTFKVTDKENGSCHWFLKERGLFSAKPHSGDRNWCWVGYKEYGCHWHLWSHISWKQMLQKAFDYGGIPNFVNYEPLKNPALCDNQEAGAFRSVTNDERAEAFRWFKEHITIFVLNLQSSVERRQQFSEHFDRLGIPFEIVWGVDLRQAGAFEVAKKQGVVPEHFDLEKAQQNANSDRNVMGPIKGTVGCASGHLKAHRTAYNHKDQKPMSMIFEDDVIVNEDFVIHTWLLFREELPCDWQAVALRTGCPYGVCVSPHLSRVLPDPNEPMDRCRHGVNYGFQCMVYRRKDLMEIHDALSEIIYDEENPHCLDVDVALASLSDKFRYYAVPASQSPGFLHENGQSVRASINYD
mmetsp:Transcript_73083/g.159835  ORF Transcript_73083/g.159835 Transcript_73083/m.159835 type:complete len:888 (-) Transcript_73083:34-2697(-)